MSCHFSITGTQDILRQSKGVNPLMKLLTVTFIAILIAIIVYTFRWNTTPLSEEKLENDNPTHYLFDLDLMSVRKKTISGFSIDSQIENRNIFSFENHARPKFARKIMLTLETADKVLFGKDVFKNKDNKNDIFLHSFGEAITSSTYFSLGKPLLYEAQFHIHFEPKTENQTIVFINVINPVVLKGIGGYGPHGSYPGKVPVKPTTVEEYKVLRYIGYLLGKSDMPAVNYPK